MIEHIGHEGSKFIVSISEFLFKNFKLEVSVHNVMIVTQKTIYQEANIGVMGSSREKVLVKFTNDVVRFISSWGEDVPSDTLFIQLMLSEKKYLQSKKIYLLPW